MIKLLFVVILVLSHFFVYLKGHNDGVFEMFDKAAQVEPKNLNKKKIKQIKNRQIVQYSEPIGTVGEVKGPDVYKPRRRSRSIASEQPFSLTEERDSAEDRPFKYEHHILEDE